MVERTRVETLLDQIRKIAKVGNDSGNMLLQQLSLKVEELDRLLCEGAALPGDWPGISKPTDLSQVFIRDDDVLPCCVRLIISLPLSYHIDNNSVECAQCHSSYKVENRTWYWCLPTRKGSYTSTSRAKSLAQLMQEMKIKPDEEAGED